MTVSNYYLDYIEDDDGNLVDIDYYHRMCADQELRAKGAHPCPEWPDYDVYCQLCEELIHKAPGDGGWHPDPNGPGDPYPVAWL